MGRILTNWHSARGDCCGKKDARGSRRRCRRRQSVLVKRSGFHVTGPKKGSRGMLLVLADWQVRVFWSSGIIDTPSDRMYLHNISLYGCIDRHYCYTSRKRLLNSPIVNFSSLLESQVLHFIYLFYLFVLDVPCFKPLVSLQEFHIPLIDDLL